MLLDLYIENFALIEKMRVSFTNGLNILTGETGAGKSILIDAVNMAIGLRADKNFIRTGSEKSIIQLIFECNQTSLSDLLKNHGIELENDQILILTRELYSNGRSVSRINDKIVTVSLVREISKYLIDIHGQHEHQSLLYSENHIDIVDSFAEKDIHTLKVEIENKFQLLKRQERKLASLYGNEIERERKIDLLKFQVNEIDECKLMNNEEETLLAERNLLANSERIHDVVSRSYEDLFHGMDHNKSLLDTLGHIVNDFNHIKEYDPLLANISQGLYEALYKLEDITRDIRLYRDRIEYDPNTLDQIEKRLDTINSLKRKYGKTIDDILSYRNRIFCELEEILNSEEIIKDLKKSIDELSGELLLLSQNLSDKRKAISLELENKVMKELSSLNMKNVSFKVDFSVQLDKDHRPMLTSKGIDHIEFLISTNSGEPLKPLTKIVSGGEMSRIMLAFKTILAAVDNIPTLIFDEIDTGISGRTATIVGEKLALISSTHQILCITHLPQIALMADNHFHIIKTSIEGHTKTTVERLKDNERIDELARLLGGVSLTQLTIEHAKEMLEQGKIFKNNLKKK
ncbi:DNA repair protein RecN (Recombination protein N) [Anaerosolibacter carboniphilus]|uniref:DNA repair protein RecN n=1 Tax=Anaerosolibacter carboniphilus TaxID=1417629 RepID=A0A841L2M1_9FIRM|nr:DNA repair protein RecN [Anaerosolibacter carboniphilus]MBB6216639.1 DNA repair protein RecN (Recombination protein N) [Anaerosolibacter carboniphilus]